MLVVLLAGVIYLFNRPRFLVPPWLRGDKGHIAVLIERRRQRA